MEEINKEKLKALQATLDRLDKSYGKGSVMRLGDEPVEKLEVIKTGSVTLDRALGVGGFPKGRVVEIYGPESSGKTTVLTAEQVKRGKRLFGASCGSCHTGGITKTNPNIGLDPEGLSLATPNRNSVAGLVDYLKNPTTFELKNLH